MVLKYLTIILFLISYSCSDNIIKSNKRVKLELLYSCGQKDTITIDYYGNLYIYSGRLEDDLGNTKATNVARFSIIDSTK